MEQLLKTGKTDENGSFKIIFNKAGEYTIIASKEGYVSAIRIIIVCEYTTSIMISEESPIK